MCGLSPRRKDGLPMKLNASALAALLALLTTSEATAQLIIGPASPPGFAYGGSGVRVTYRNGHLRVGGYIDSGYYYPAYPPPYSQTTIVTPPPRITINNNYYGGPGPVL